MNYTKESIKRSLVKTVVWRIVVFIADFSIAYFFTKDLDLSTKLAFTKVVISFMLYFIHERAWNRVAWGRY